ncbi:MAG: RNA polymerase sigma factor RpoH [Candidatus Dactylopiibacterium carminicum]|uniref:RNA polymerase sigma factor RpoH n=1 Tax=Candidatus Dactylopiibacterium carminicum TaxID=857335 RepID=A0A272EYI4_9RHOO|nr:RNA polymerase sigma factor RpoH [Candidatus Dactylopiibacterium carminicum]KAF7600591.1 RNA polymerase sigma factor RpoH [Candidatus Dactylopiibacterium carminicum]PAS95173.1 MAG: RNA polymerase sigma factor RpoH [Candidatus Dactylopiibacterium carminicum]PAT00594.1 MAG: RNA polymerase factor sigma-32 [Candidatus Dactylopiibacterium carminicum]
MTQALAFPVPNPLGNIDQYVQAVNRYPLLTEEQEHDLALRLKNDNDLDAARQLVLSHLRLVVSIARNYLGYGLPHADLIQEGNIGLMKAVKRFDPDRGVRLVSFAIHWIKAEIHEYIVRNWRLVKIATTKAQRKLFFNLRSLRGEGSSLSPEDVQGIAGKLGVKPEEVVEMETRFAGGEVAIDRGSDEDDERMAPIDWLADDSAEPVEVLATAQAERLADEGLKGALASLDERSRNIVARRWLVEDNPATLHELAAEYGVSAERIRQIEAKAMQKMRLALSA